MSIVAFLITVSFVIFWWMIFGKDFFTETLLFRMGKGLRGHLFSVAVWLFLLLGIANLAWCIVNHRLF